MADPIPANKRTPWIPGGTIGVNGGIPTRTNVTLISTMDGTGVTNCSVILNAAIAAAASNSVLVIPDGIYKFTSSISHVKNGVVVRGSGRYNTNSGAGTKFFFSTAVPGIVWGPAGLSVVSAIRTYNVNGSTATAGSTNLSFLTGTNGVGTPLIAGTVLKLRTSTRNIGTASLPIISVANSDYIIAMPIRIVSRTGTNVVISQPLPWNFTNAPIAEPIVDTDSGIQPTRMAAFEDMTMTMTNNGTVGSGIAIIQAHALENCWLKSVDMEWANNYHIELFQTLDFEIRDCSFRHAFTGGTSHAGLLVTDSDGLWVENCIFADGLAPTMEFGIGGMRNVFSYNYSTATVQGFTSHNAHPAMFLFEGNIQDDNFKLDGYFGSTSHMTVFRNKIKGTVYLKRFSSNNSIVGNILGPTNIDQVYIQNFTNAYSVFPLIEVGYPNTGNNNYIGKTTDPLAWNYPGNYFIESVGTGQTWTNGMTHFTEDQGPTNVFWLHSFTNVPSPSGATFALLLQSGANTNYYYGFSSNMTLIGNVRGTSSNLFLAGISNVVTTNIVITVTNTDTLFVAGVSAYQQLQQGDQATDIIHDNGCYVLQVYTNIMDSVITDTNLVSSYLYTAKPSWFGTNIWPGIGPDIVGLYNSNPAQDRYNGINQTIITPGSYKTSVSGTANVSGTVKVK